MIKILKNIMVVLLLIWFAGCSSSRPALKTIAENNRVTDLSYLSGDSTSYMLKEVENLVELGHRSLSISDSIGAMAYFENAFVQFTEIPLEKREELLKDSLFSDFYNRQLNDPYNELKNSLSYFVDDSTSTDAVQEEISEFIAVESQVSDSVLIEEEKGLEIPEDLNHKVKLAIKYFTTTSRGRRVMSRWLERSTRYGDLIRSILREEGAPEDLFYLALIESGLNPKAKSYARAVGPWQFINSTGKAYGLTNSFWYDERSDFVKATRSAAKHLLDLYESFGDWYFALAGYNYSPRRLKNRIKKSNASNFWEVSGIPRQTRNYVPTFLAARHVAKNHETYGFVIDSLPRFEFDTVMIRESIDLSVVAEMVDTTHKCIMELNPAVKRWVTPPDVDEWTLYLPLGTREIFKQKYAEIPESEKRHYIYHKVLQGQTLSHISYRYGVPIWLIKKTNKISGSMIRVGQNLIIPVPANKKAYYASIKQKPIQNISRKQAKNNPKPTEKGKELVAYTVKNGDNLFDISLRYNVTISKLRYWNNLDYDRYIYPGQILNIWLPKEVAEASGVPDNQGMAVTVQPSPVPSQAVITTGIDGDHIIYIVKSGDTLWQIAREHNTSIKNIKEWNSRRSNKIKPGDKLIIYK